MNSTRFIPSASFTIKHFRYASTFDSIREDAPGAELLEPVGVRAFERPKLQHRHSPEETLVAEILRGEIRTRIFGQFRPAAAPRRIKLRQIRGPAAGENLDRIRVRGRALLEPRRAEG